MSSCRRFLGRCDHGDPQAIADPHPSICPACAEALRQALAIRDRLREAGAAGVPDRFASRVGRLAWLSAQDRRSTGVLPLLVPLARGLMVAVLIFAGALTLSATLSALAIRSVPEGVARFSGEIWGLLVSLLTCFGLAARYAILRVRGRENRSTDRSGVRS